MSSFKDLLDSRRGYDEFAKKEKEIEERQKTFVNRFWLPAEGSTKIVFLDDNPPIIEEHQLKIGGDWRNWVTCLRLIGEACPACDILNDNPYTVGFYTIIDTAVWTDKKGTERRNEKKLFPAKFKVLQMLKRLSSKRGSLVGCVFDVYRSSKDAFNTGDVFDYEGKLTDEQIKQLNKDAVPFDYAEILKPKSAAEIKKLLQGNAENMSEDMGFSDFDMGDTEVKF
mgnify:CR=1 FL=1